MLVKIVLIIILIIIFFECHQKKEHLTQTLESKIDLLADPLFSDVTLYKNDDNPYEPGQKTGYEKCLRNCNKGTCVEFGLSGAAFCFPPKNYGHSKTTT